jgi:hypothetical protein
MRRRWAALAMLAVAGCGRLLFEPRGSGTGDGSAADTSDSGGPGSGIVVIGNATTIATNNSNITMAVQIVADVGSRVIVAVQTGAPGGLVFTDTQGNPYAQDAQAAGGRVVTIGSAILAHALTTADHIIITYSNFNGSSSAAAVVIPGHESNGRDQSGTGTGSGTTASTSITAPTSVPDEVLFGSIAWDGASATLNVPPLGYTNHTVGFGGAPPSMLWVGWLPVNQTGTYQVSATFTSMFSWAAIICSYPHQ